MRIIFRLRAPLCAFAAALPLLTTGSALALPFASDNSAAAPKAVAGFVLAAAGRAGKTAGQTTQPGPPPSRNVAVPAAPEPAPAPPAPPAAPTAAAPVNLGGASAATATAPPDAPAPAAASSASASASASSSAHGSGRAPKGLPQVTMPTPGETRFKQDQVVVAISARVSPSRIAAILRRHRLVEIDSTGSSSFGAALRVWSFSDHRTVAKVERELSQEVGLGSLQPNYVYAAMDEVAAVSQSAGAPGMYALDKLRVAAGLDLVGSEPVKVAVVDTAIDEAHPDLVGVVEARFDAVGGGAPPRSLDHGTAMAGAIAARGQVRGVAPSVRILSARAFDTDGAGGALGSSVTIIKGIDWAVRSGARVINMSFAGPKDPALHETLAAAAKKGIVLIGAMGNAGPKSPPLYPGADENVIAITATDADDHVFPMANVGPYVAAAAPGVDVLLPAPNAGYSLETGTSVSAALASGVVALALERKPRATVSDVRKWLAAGARRPAAGVDKALIGAGVIDATATMRATGVDGLAGR